MALEQRKYMVVIVGVGIINAFFLFTTKRIIKCVGTDI